MQTRIISVSEKQDALNTAFSLLTEGNVVVLPTETVYGLGANVYSQEGVEKIYQVKNRPKDNPLICHIADLSMLEELVEFPKTNDYKKLMEKFWPGALTLVFKKKEGKINFASEGFNTVAVRMPSHPFFLELIRFCCFPIAAPSANISGRPSGTSFEFIYKELGTLIPLIIKDSPCEIGIESTVLDLTGTYPQILRPGAISLEQIKEILPDVTLLNSFHKKEGEIKSPGLKYKHYKPTFKVVVYSNIENIENFLKLNPELKNTYFIFSIKDTQNRQIPIDEFYVYKSIEEFTHDLYRLYYELEQKGVDVLFIKEIEKEGLATALMERIERSADLVLN